MWMHINNASACEVTFVLFDTLIVINIYIYIYIYILYSDDHDLRIRNYQLQYTDEKLSDLFLLLVYAEISVPIYWLVSMTVSDVKR